MKIIKPSIQLVDEIDAEKVLRKLEFACRTCYQSYDKTGEDSHLRLLKSCILRGHESILEHQSITFFVTCSRKTLAQWTRHRLASPSVESQRYCNYGKNDQGITYINPWFDSDKVDQDSWDNFVCACEDAESAYMTLLEAGNKPEMARDVLPQCTATHMVWTANIREIRHFLRMRTSLAAEKEIRTLANAMYDLLVENGLQILVEDIPVKHA